MRADGKLSSILHLLLHMAHSDGCRPWTAWTNGGERASSTVRTAMGMNWTAARSAHRRQCMMKELFVRADSRGRGVGRALMAWIARDAAGQGCGRIDWHVKASNEAGIRFYAGLGAQRVADRLSYRLPLDPAAGQDVMRFQPDRTAAFIRSHVDEPLPP